MNTYRTAEVAAMIGIHPNTVRLYETLKLIPAPERRPNGYRVFTDLHVAQFRVARLAFEVEILQNGLRKKIVQMVKTSAAGDFDGALALAGEYLAQVHRERANAEEAIALVRQILRGECAESAESAEIAEIAENGMRGESTHFLKRREAAEYLGISTDTLRNWELNGLLTVKRMQNGYRVYTDEDIRRLKIIRSLRCANYSLEAILGMLCQLSRNPDIDIRQALDTPRGDAQIIAACDKLISSLSAARDNAEKIIELLQEMKIRFS